MRKLFLSDVLLILADFPLKYGCNPHQLPANIYKMAGGNLPFKVCSLASSYSPAFSVCSVSGTCSSEKGMCEVGGGAGKRHAGADTKCMKRVPSSFGVLEGTHTYALHLCMATQACVLQLLQQDGVQWVARVDGAPRVAWRCWM